MEDVLISDLYKEGTLLSQDRAITVASSLNREDTDGWVYKVKNPYEAQTVIEVYDEDNNLLGEL